MLLLKGLAASNPDRTDESNKYTVGNTIRIIVVDELKNLQAVVIIRNKFIKLSSFLVRQLLAQAPVQQMEQALLFYGVHGGDYTTSVYGENL